MKKVFVQTFVVFLFVSFSSLYSIQIASALGAKGSPQYRTEGRIKFVAEHVILFQQRCNFTPSKKDFLEEIYSQNIKKICDKQFIDIWSRFWGSKDKRKMSESGDGWGRSILYFKSKKGFKLVSYGADGKPGGEGKNKDIEKEFEFTKK